MIEENLKVYAQCTKVFPPKYYVYPMTTPEGLMLGNGNLDCSNLKLDFGQFFQEHDDTTNYGKPRSIGVIAIRPKNNKGSHYFIPLRRGTYPYSTQWE